MEVATSATTTPIRPPRSKSLLIASRRHSHHQNELSSRWPATETFRASGPKQEKNTEKYRKRPSPENRTKIAEKNRKKWLENGVSGASSDFSAIFFYFLGGSVSYIFPFFCSPISGPFSYFSAIFFYFLGEAVSYSFPFFFSLSYFRLEARNLFCSRPTGSHHQNELLDWLLGCVWVSHRSLRCPKR